MVRPLKVSFARSFLAVLAIEVSINYLEDKHVKDKKRCFLGIRKGSTKAQNFQRQKQSHFPNSTNWKERKIPMYCFIVLFCFVRDDASKTKMDSKSLYWNGLWRTWIYFLNPKFNESNRPSVFSIPYNLHFTPDKFLRAKLLRCENIILESKWFEKRKKTLYIFVWTF